jgi:hypothetical protein
MSYGVLWVGKNNRFGCGLPYVVVLVKSWLTPWEIAVPIPANSFTTICLTATDSAKATVTFGFEVENPQALTDCEFLGFSTSKAYKKVFPKTSHQALGKEAGQTNHVERWNNTLRQRMARFVRKTLSFSKSLDSHHMFTKWFIFHYNLECPLSCT